MKFKHAFTLSDSSPSSRKYKCGSINAVIDFVGKNALRVAIYKDGDTILPTFAVDPQNELSHLGRDKLSVKGMRLFTPEVRTDGNTERFKLANGIEITLTLDNFLLSYSNENGLLFSDRAPLAYNLENEFGSGSFHYVSREPDERIFGLGDKCGSVNKSGRAFRIETSDSMGYDASSSDPLYKHIPFYMCDNSAGSYGIFYDTSATAYINLGEEINNYYEPYKYFKTDESSLIYYVFFGSKAEILSSFCRLCGKQAFPPKWSFDYCASTMAYTDAPNSEKQMNAFLNKLKETDLSCGGFYLSSGYTSIGDQRYVFNWNRDKFPEPSVFVKRFSDSGIELIPNIKPAFLDSHPMYEGIKDSGMFVTNPDGTPFVTQFWDGLGSYLDFTDGSAFDFWKNQVWDKLLNLGIKATWNDNNEFDVKDADALAKGFGKGSVKASEIRPVLTYLMVLASYEAQREAYPKLRPFLSSRSGGIGIRRLAQTWSGDNRTEFADLRYCHYIGLTMSMSGLFFYGHDLGGFTGDMPSRELLLRWLQHGIFEPRFTIHSWNSDGTATMPWSYPDITDSVRELFAQRKQLAPYLYNSAYVCVRDDVPMNSPLCFRYGDCDADADAMLVGRDILAAFIFDEGSEQTEVYLPKDEDWYLGSELHRGGETVMLSIPASSRMPYFVRAGSVIAANESAYGFNSEEKTVLTVYPVELGEFESEFFTDDGLTYEYRNGKAVMLKIKVTCDENEVTVSYRNNGKTDFIPEFRLVSSDGRKLVII